MSLENAIEVQKEIYLDLGRKLAATLFMFDMQNRPISIPYIKFIYEILFSESDFRNKEALLVNQDGETIKFPKPETIHHLVDELVVWLGEEKKASKTHPIVLSAIFHHKFVSIHPFNDGNGRIGRLLMNIILMSYGYLPILIEPNEKVDYYIGLLYADKGDNSKLISFLSRKEKNSLVDFVQGPEYLSLLAKFELKNQLQKIKGTEKCFVLTEDSNSDSLLKLVLKASGFNMEETTVIPYKGSSNIVSTSLFAVFVKEKLPHVSIVVHRDKEYLTTKELVKQKKQFDKIGVYFFVTRGTDVKSYFISPEHINFCHPQISVDKAKLVIEESIKESRDYSIRKFRIKEFGEKQDEKSIHLDEALISIFENNIFRFSHGKTVLGLIKSKVQQILKTNSQLEVLSPYLQDGDLAIFSSQIWNKE